MSAKISINIQMPTEHEKPESLEDKIEDAMEAIEYGTDREAYLFLRKVNNCLAKKYKENKCTPKGIEILRKLTPFMAKHGLHDTRGIVLAEEMVTNPDYEKED